MNEVHAKQIGETMTTPINKLQQLLAKEVFSPQITTFGREE